jgi:hypothetical protein
VAGLLHVHLSASKVVRASTMLGAADMSGDGRPEGDPERRALALAGDDQQARQLIARLYNEFGFDAVDIGGLVSTPPSHLYRMRERPGCRVVDRCTSSSWTDDAIDPLRADG